MVNDPNSGFGSYNGYVPSDKWNIDSRPLGEATNVLRSFVIQNIIQDSQWEIDRITRYYLFWKFYDGLHYRDFNDGMLSFNYIRAFIDKINMFLLGNEAFSFFVKSFYSSKVDRELEKLVEELMMYHWGKSNKVQVAYEMLQMGSITGDCWVGIGWKDAEDEKYCKISVFDSRQVFPTFENGDYNKVTSLLIRQPLLYDNNQNGYKLFVMEYTDKTVRTWFQKDVAIAKNTTHYEEKKSKNNYGFIPVVHIKNRPNSESYFGKSDANDILKINKIYNDLMQQLKAVIDYHVTPTTVITGASAKSLKKGLGQIWSGLPPEANVFNLGLDVDLSATVNYAKDLKTAMHELSDVPENALGKIQAISNTSAAALQITYHPLMQQANLKAVTYGEAIAKLNNMMLRILQVENPEDERLVKILEMEPDFVSSMNVEPVFAYGFPKDKQDDLNKADVELRLRISSRREIMERMGKQNVPELMEEIDQEFIEQTMLQLRINQLAVESQMGGGSQNPMQKPGTPEESEEPEEPEEEEIEETSSEEPEED